MSVSGGYSNIASGDSASASAGKGNWAYGAYSAVRGGQNYSANNMYSYYP